METLTPDRRSVFYCCFVQHRWHGIGQISLAFNVDGVDFPRFSGAGISRVSLAFVVRLSFEQPLRETRAPSTRQL